MAFSLRLPPSLDLEARKRADQIGVPLNGLICFALDLYLRGGGVSGRAETIVDSLDFENPHRVSRGGMALKIPQSPKVPTSRPPAGDLRKAPAVPVQTDSARVLSPPGPHASKAERKAYTAQMRLARKA